MASIKSWFKRTFFKKREGDHRQSNSEKTENNADKQEESRPGCSTVQEVRPIGECKDYANMGPNTTGGHAYHGGVNMDNEPTLERPDHKEDCESESIGNASLRSSLNSAENTNRESMSEAESFEKCAHENESLDESLESMATEAKPSSDQDNNVTSDHEASNNLIKQEGNELVTQLQQPVEISNRFVNKDETDMQQLQWKKAAVSEEYYKVLHVHAQEQAQSKVEPLVSGVLLNEKLKSIISLKLDGRSSVLANWENLACELDAPPNIKAQCRRTTMESPTELLFESFNSWRHTENLTVNEVIAFLNEMKRKDAVEVIEKAIPAHQRDCQV
ncbi:uncharacterized protein LOC116292164, partial [Actinia tenebrosa]|uniref:Uncharacterized protein LOC116292164 n=1 Tax=Actinia tenebrosa TaxID=6105 RepID=A0A6P8HK70_ACTTE